MVATGCVMLGVVLVGAPVAWVSYTDAVSARAQTDALAAWDRAASNTVDSGRRGPAPAGFALEIPRLGVRRFVPDGATPDHLRRFGVGRISWTGWPGDARVVAVAGHRTTYGAPFLRIDSLRAGDAIIVDYRAHRYGYEVVASRVVRPDQAEVLDQAPPDVDEIALVTCTPRYSAAFRLIVWGRLRAPDASTVTR